MTPKLLYLMHVSWGWIKQRPHFFAEKLSKEFDVDVYGLEGLRNRHQNQLNKDRNIKYRPLYILGFIRSLAWKNKGINWIYKKLVSLQLGDLKKYKYIWITNTLFYNFIKDLITDSQVLIYDCMDDDLEFPYVKNNPELAEYFLKLEGELVDRADYILFSAKYLSDKVNKRSVYNLSKMQVINNAVELPNFNETIILPDEIQNKLNVINSNHPCLLYIGTISQWFDFDIFNTVFKTCPNLRLILVGPKEVEIPQNNNIIYLGLIERKYIFSIMKQADALCMPFKVTELIRSVNPVKLYEYIYAEKPVIAPLYEETEKFSDFIYLYKDEKEFVSYCKLIVDSDLSAKKGREDAMSFVESNTWDNRFDRIKKFIFEN